MTDYKVAIGHDVPTNDLDVVDPQPKTIGVQATRRVYGANGQPYEEGLYVEFEFNVLPDAGIYLDLLEQFGIDSDGAFTSDVTIYARNAQYVFGRYNGVAVQPEVGKDMSWEYFPRNIKILVRGLEALVEV